MLLIPSDTLLLLGIDALLFPLSFLFHFPPNLHVSLKLPCVLSVFVLIDMHITCTFCVYLHYVFCISCHQLKDV